MPILIVLSIWTLMAIAIDLGMWQALECCLGDWLVWQVSQRIFGKAIARVTRKIVDWVAGVELITEIVKALTTIVSSLLS
jgi:hypothetical protein